MRKFNLKKLNYVALKEQYEVKISNRFAALEYLDDNVDISRDWKIITQNIKASATDG
jgi:hypothetical protein